MCWGGHLFGAGAGTGRCYPEYGCLGSFTFKTSFLFDSIGSASNGFHMVVTGKGLVNNRESRQFELVVNRGDGPYRRCVEIINKQKYLAALKDLDSHWAEHGVAGYT